MDRFDPKIKLQDINNPDAIDLNNDPMNRFDPFSELSEVYKEVVDWGKDPMNKPQNQNKYFFSDGKTYYEQICKMLRLMSVFKQAFNQIYDNEDEIHSAWENFVDNLSATAVYGEEVGVNLTWTDTSVNFAFTIPGGEDGVGIQSITFNSDYTMTITLTDGQTYTSDSLRGPQGEQGIQGIQGPAGPQGEPGSGLEILDVYATLQDLQTAHPTGSPGDAYQVGTAPSYTLYIWSASQSAWVPAGTIGSAVPSSADPLMDGIASAGISDLYARGDHVHPTDTSRASVMDLNAVDDKVDAVDDRVDDLNDFINTSQKLIDQSFVYRESPATHDGLAILDKIKGNTVKFNQLVNVINYNNALRNNVSFIPTTKGISISGTCNASTQVALFNQYELSIIGHKYYIRGIPENSPINVRGGDNTTEWHNSNWITTATTTDLLNIAVRIIEGTTYNVELYLQVFDLTLIGIDNLTTVEQVETWLSNNIGLLPYYDYTPGALIPFKGTGLKTTGKNLLKTDISGTQLGITFTKENGILSARGRTTGSGRITLTSTPFYLPSDCIFSSNVSAGAFAFQFRRNNQNVVTLPTGRKVIVPKGWYDTFALYVAVNNTFNYDFEFQLEIGSTPSSFEPYTESTLSLETLNTLFPTGMKEAGTVYDELTSNRADTRIGEVDLGSLNWVYRSEIRNGLFSVSANDIPYALKLNTPCVCSKYEYGGTVDGVSAISTDKRVFLYFYQVSTSRSIYVYDTSYTDATTFKQMLTDQNVKLYYELATPIEQDIDLDLSFKAYQGGTEQLLPVNGSTPTTSSLLADMTYFSINDAMDYILAKLDQVPSSITADINSLKTRMTSAEGDITSLGSRMTTAEGNITSLAGRMTTAEGNITSLSGRMTSAEGNITSNASRISTLENNLFKVEVKEEDFDSISSGSNFGRETTITVEEGYKAIGVVGTEIQTGQYTNPVYQLAVTQCHVHYTTNNALRMIIGGKNNNADVTYTNVRLYAYILCMKDYQSE